MKDDQHPSIPKHFASLTDPRKENKRHKLIDVITIAICAVICNADNYTHICEFGQTKHEWFKKFFKFPHGELWSRVVYGKVNTTSKLVAS